MSSTLLRTSVRLLHPFGAVLNDEGVPVEQLLEEASIPLQVYNDPDARVPRENSLRFLLAATMRTRHAALGLEAARRHDHAQFQLLNYLVSSSISVGAGLAEVIRYQSLLGDACFMRLEPRDGGLLLRHTGTAARTPVICTGSLSATLSRLGPEYVVGGIALALHREIGGRVSAESSGQLGSDMLCEGWFSYPEPDCAEAYRRLFGTSLRFDAGVTGLMIPQAVADMRPPQANRRVHDLLERDVEEQMRHIAAVRSFAERVREQIFDDLSHPDLSLDRAAAKLRMSRSTFKRRLADEGWSYSKLVDDTRRTVALDYLHRGLRIHEVAFMVGYRNFSAFHRAFRRWTDLSPAEYRRRQDRSGNGPQRKSRISVEIP
jgi:AraC-like DNA-binding protein